MTTINMNQEDLEYANNALAQAELDKTELEKELAEYKYANKLISDYAVEHDQDLNVLVADLIASTYYRQENDLLKEEIENLNSKIANITFESKMDYDDMRKFQDKYIKSDHLGRVYEDTLTKIAFLKNEWDDPEDFIKDLQDIAKQSLSSKGDIL